MGARLINNPRQINRGHIDAFPVLDIRALRKSRFFNEGQLTQCSLRHDGLSHAVLIIVDLRFEYDLKVIVKRGDSNTDIQRIGLTHRPAGFNGRRWYFVSERRKRGDAVLGRWAFPDAERGGVDLSLPIYGRAGSRARTKAKT